MEPTSSYFTDNDTAQTMIYEPQTTSDSNAEARSEPSFYCSLDSKHEVSFKRPLKIKEDIPQKSAKKSEHGETKIEDRHKFKITPPDWANNRNAWAYLQSQSPKYKNMYLDRETVGREREGYLFGRSKTCDIVFSDENISKNHCLIYMEAGSNATAKGIRIFLKDLSTNGTFINKEKVDRDQRRLLKSGDIIQLYRSNRLADDNIAHLFYRILFPCAFDVQTCKEDYLMQDFLGNGTFATVYRAHHRKTDKVVAVKVIEKARFARNKRLLKTINDETVIMMAMERHPCAVGINHVYNEEKNIYLILDYVKDGELFNYVVDKRKLSEDETRFIFWQLLKTIQWLHNKQITHRDLKPENILLADKEKLHVKVTDFGLAKILARGEKLDGQCGTPNYIAPEILDPAEDRSYGVECDMWSLGVLLFICLSGYPPFSDKKEGVSMKKQIREGKYEFASPYWDDISSEAKELVQRLLTVDPLDRASCREALESPWMLMNADYMEAKFEALGQDIVQMIEEKSKSENVPDTQTLEASGPLSLY
ncbi:kinase-like domain-containing protein [Sporodiniella umbellata]|nr:kinase-like domain-containing protein [Sporodiniella umbellata]